MRIAVVGGAGFVGSHLVEALVRRKHSVLVYDNLSSGKIPGKAQSKFSPFRQTQFVCGDILNYRQLSATLRSFRPDALYHLAATSFIPYCEAHPAQTIRVNVQGTLNVMRAVQSCPTLRGVIFTSSANVYAPSARLHRETDPPAPLDVYALSKQLAERLVCFYGQRAGRTCFLLRLVNIYGPGDHNPHLVPQIIFELNRSAKELRLGRLDTRRDFIYVTDVVEVLRRMASLLQPEPKAPLCEILNLGSGQEYSGRQIVATLCQLAGVAPKCIQSKSRMRDVDRERLRCDTQRVRKLLSWKPRYSLAAGLRKTLQASGIPVKPV
jgi:UDP-glucose 4-epimerase